MTKRKKRTPKRADPDQVFRQFAWTLAGQLTRRDTGKSSDQRPARRGAANGEGAR